MQRVWFEECVGGTSRRDLGLVQSPDESFRLADDDVQDGVRAREGKRLKREALSVKFAGLDIAAEAFRQKMRSGAPRSRAPNRSSRATGCDSGRIAMQPTVSSRRSGNGVELSRHAPRCPELRDIRRFLGVSPSWRRIESVIFRVQKRIHKVW